MLTETVMEYRVVWNMSEEEQAFRPFSDIDRAQSFAESLASQFTHGKVAVLEREVGPWGRIWEQK